MQNDTGTQERAFSTKDIAAMVGIAEPTVRKYAQSLEKAGYHFIKSESGSRVFIEFDAMVLRHLKELREKSNMPVQVASEVIVTKYNKKPIHSESLPDIPVNKQYDKQYALLEEKVEKQNEIIERLVQTVRSHQEELIKIGDQGKLLMQSVEEVQETNKLLLRTETKKKKDKEKKGFLSRFLNR